MFLQQATVEQLRSGMPVVNDEESFEGVSIILERKPDAGSPYVWFDEREYGNIVKVRFRHQLKAKAVGID